MLMLENKNNVEVKDVMFFHYNTWRCILSYLQTQVINKKIIVVFRKEQFFRSQDHFNFLREDKVVYLWRKKRGLSYNCAQEILYGNTIPVLDNRKYLPNIQNYIEDCACCSADCKYIWHHINIPNNEIDNYYGDKWKNRMLFLIK